MDSIDGFDRRRRLVDLIDAGKGKFLHVEGPTGEISPHGI